MSHHVLAYDDELYDNNDIDDELQTKSSSEYETFRSAIIALVIGLTILSNVLVITFVSLSLADRYHQLASPVITDNSTSVVSVQPTCDALIDAALLLQRDTDNRQQENQQHAKTITDNDKHDEYVNTTNLNQQQQCTSDNTHNANNNYHNNNNYNILITYNLCEEDNHYMTPNNYPKTTDNNKNEEHDHIPYPFIHILQYHKIFYIYEIRYDYTYGLFIFYANVFSENWQDRAAKDDYSGEMANVKNVLKEVYQTLSCWDSLTQTVTPVTKRMSIESEHMLFECPYAAFPQLIPPDLSSFSLVLLRNYGGAYMTPISLTDAIAAIAANSNQKKEYADLSVCAYHRPLTDWSWCSNGLQGHGMATQLHEFILYHHYLGIDRFMFFDDDGLYGQTLSPWINISVVDYYRSPKLFKNQPQGYIQDLQMDICRARYWYSTRFILFTDIDEFVIFAQPNDEVAQIQEDLNAEAIEHILMDSNYIENQIRMNENKQSKNQSIISTIMSSISATTSQLTSSLLESSNSSSAITSPFIASSMLNTAVTHIQNLAEARQFYVVSTLLLECLALEDADSTSVSILERFHYCNLFYLDTKYWFRPAQGLCLLSGHTPNCPLNPNINFYRKDQIMLYHLYNIKKQRIVYDPNDKKYKHIAVPQLKNIVNMMGKYYPFQKPLRV